MTGSMNGVIGFTANGVDYTIEMLGGDGSGGSAFQLLDTDGQELLEPTQDFNAVVAEVVALFGGSVRSTGAFSDAVIGEGEADLFDVRVQGNDIVALGGKNVGGQFRYVVEDDAAATEFGSVFQHLVDAFNTANFADAFVPAPDDDPEEFLITFDDIPRVPVTDYQEDGFTFADAVWSRAFSDGEIGISVGDVSQTQITNDNGDRFDLVSFSKRFTAEADLVLSTEKGEVTIAADATGVIDVSDEAVLQDVTSITLGLESFAFFQGAFLDDFVLAV